jgi:cardiolipin synthase A/B
MNRAWIPGNRVRLLENGDAFFPRVMAAIEAARDEVLVETFILFDDKVGRRLRDALIAAARRDVRVELTLDGYGSPDLPHAFTAALVDAGVHLRYFDPKPRLLGLRTNLFRRLHRKIVVVDARLAFVGGINFSADHLTDFSDKAKQDYSIEVEGPAVAAIHAFARAALEAADAPRGWEHAGSDGRASVGDASLRLVSRDRRHPTDIEDEYIEMIRGARRRVVVANAYFLPGYRLLRELRRAARRGVEVTLLLQGNPDEPIVANAARGLYPYLLGGGVRIVEYCQRPLHAKLALVDDDWTTVGSSNLDPPEPVAQPGGQRFDPRPRLQQLRRCAPATPGRPALPRDPPRPVATHAAAHAVAVAAVPRHPPPAGMGGAVAGAHASGSDAGARAGTTAMSWRLRLPPWRALLVAALLLLAGWLLWRQVRSIDWREVVAALAGYPHSQLALAALAAAFAHACYCGLDLLARGYMRHHVPRHRVLAIAFVGYALALNIGGTVGGIGFRYRLYSRAGLGVATISRIVAFAIAGNWSGFLLLAGLVFLLHPVPLPQRWEFAESAQRMLGGGLLALLAAALAMATWSPRRRWAWRGHEIELPAVSFALRQVAVATASWLAIANLLHLLLPAGIDYATTLGVLLWSVLANLVIRVPGNLGVLEAVFLALLGSRAPAAAILAALLAYRALFYIGPLLLALGVYAWLEASERR